MDLGAYRLTAHGPVRIAVDQLRTALDLPVPHDRATALAAEIAEREATIDLMEGDGG